MNTRSLIDDLLPVFDVAASHAIDVDASAEQLFDALRTADLAPAPVRALLAARMLPSLFAARSWSLGKAVERLRSPVTVDSFEAAGFKVLAADPPRELVLGLVGRFWTPDGDLRRIDRESFTGPQPAGTARAAWNFLIEPGLRGCRLVTETRVQAADAGSRRAFLRYWRVIAPGSAFIRRQMLAAIRRAATRSQPVAGGRQHPGLR